MPREPLSTIDAAWLRMEDPSHPMMISMAMTFGPSLDLERLRATLAERMLSIRRFRQRAVQPRGSSGRPYWDDHADVDLDYHLRPISLRPPGDEAALRDVISELMSIQLDSTRPLWQFHLVEEYGEGWALVGRVHHCLADGPALMHVLLALTDSEDGMSRPFATPEVSAEPGQGMSGFAGHITEVLVQEGLGVLRHPTRALSLTRLGTGAVASLHKLVMRPHDPETVLRGTLGAAKRAAWSAPMALDEIKAVGRLVGGTVNDVMVAASAGALRRYLQGRGEPVDGLTIRAGLSVDLRSHGDAPELGNHAGAVLVGLPIGVADPLERLVEVKREMDALKRSPEGALVRGLLSALGQAPPDAQDALVEAYCTRDTAVMANVPGPRHGIQLAGARLETLLFWVPAFGRVGLGLNIMSYAGQVRLSVATDQGLVPDPETIVEAFRVELDALEALAGQPEGERVVVESSIHQMSTMLDEALRTLDAMLERKEGGQRG
jgi:diacylglycerol O-acyltransferase